MAATGTTRGTAIARSARRLRIASLRRSAVGLGVTAVGLLLLASLVATVHQIAALRGWTSTFAGHGEFSVSSCAVEPGLAADRVRCRGELAIVDGETAVVSTLIGPRSAFGSTVPDDGDVIEAYHRVGEPGVAYPMAARTIELARSLVSVLPLSFVLIGSAAWLAGWLATRGLDRDDGVRRPYRYTFPQRFGLRPRGVLWLTVGLTLVAGDELVLDGLLGSSGLA
ncbi:MAG: hypothetical protein ACFCVK_16475 [Acidimicrobiales bacterium]